MYRPYSFCFLVLVFAPWTAADRGFVLSFGPPGEYKYFISKQENDNNDKDSELANVWIKKDNKDFVNLVCNKYEINAHTDSVISQLRAKLVTKDGIELDSFVVKECNEDKLLATISVSQSADLDTNKEYDVIFKNDKNTCQQRNYQVDITPHEVSPTIAGTRSKLEDTGYVNCPATMTVDGLVIGWLQDGLTHNLIMLQKYITAYHFNCDRCMIYCGKSKNGDKAVDLVIDSVAVDRVRVSSCSKADLKTSIKLDVQFTVGKRKKAVYMRYLNPDGTCYERRYEYDILAMEDRMLERAFVKRGGIQINTGCAVMKVKGVGRLLVNTARHHIGWGNRNGQTKPNN